MDCGFLSSYNKSIWELTLELITCIFQVYVPTIKHLPLHQALQALERRNSSCFSEHLIQWQDLQVPK